MSAAMMGEFGRAYPNSDMTEWRIESKLGPVKLRNVDDVEEFHRMVEINIGDAIVLQHDSEPDTEEYIYREEFGGRVHYWAKYKLEEVHE